MIFPPKFNHAVHQALLGQAAVDTARTKPLEFSSATLPPTTPFLIQHSTPADCDRNPGCGKL
ncbi:hypothetical protein KBC79_02610 [Candidatus Woesebacteria bacterium]|nr:hypothetical protein [Candidatus Woesebacteria bacterium]